VSEILVPRTTGLHQEAEDLVSSAKGLREKSEDLVSSAKGLREKSKDLHRESDDVSSLAEDLCPYPRVLVQETAVLLRRNKGLWVISKADAPRSKRLSHVSTSLRLESESLFVEPEGLCRQAAARSATNLAPPTYLSGQGAISSDGKTTICVRRCAAIRGGRHRVHVLEGTATRAQADIVLLNAAGFVVARTRAGAREPLVGSRTQNARGSEELEVNAATPRPQTSERCPRHPGHGAARCGTPGGFFRTTE
jgi:hypothetical protein